MADTTPIRYVLWYRRGGAKNFSWRSTLSYSTDPMEVSRSGTDTRRMGYPTLVLPYGELPPDEFEPSGMQYWDTCRGIPCVVP